MKGNSFFRMKTSAPTLELETAGPNSLAALMGRFRNEGQKEDYCLKAKPDAPSGIITSRYNENQLPQGQAISTI